MGQIGLHYFDADGTRPVYFAYWFPDLISLTRQSRNQKGGTSSPTGRVRNWDLRPSLPLPESTPADVGNRGWPICLSLSVASSLDGIKLGVGSVVGKELLVRAHFDELGPIQNNNQISHANR